MSDPKIEEIDDDIPDEFLKIMTDLHGDLINTFPEYKDRLEQTYADLKKNDKELVRSLFVYCKTKYPERFFDLLYQNDEMFEKPDIDTHFLPNIDFKEIWNEDITDNTRKIIWKYLQLICFSVINTETSQDTFGDTAKLFEAINEDELKSKLTETMEQMSDVFGMEGVDLSGIQMPDISGKVPEDIPDPEELHNHISGLLDGKLGRLATEITEETIKDFQDISGVNSMDGIFKVLFKNPGKLMNMVKKIGGNLDERIKSGEIKESELIEEAGELMKKLENMPGMKNMKNMMSQMGLPTGGSGKLDMGAMKGQMQRNMGKAKLKERLRKKLEHRKKNVVLEPSVSNVTQIKILEEQLAEAKAANLLLSTQKGSTETTSVVVESGSKKRRKRRNKKSVSK
jgi:hypothetical protein